MDIFEVMEKRHSVRSYTIQKIEEKIVDELGAYIEECNEKSGMHIQLCLDEPNAFNSFMAHYGSFKNVNNYIAIVGKKGKDFEQMCGYWGEKVVLKATELGLSTCWVAMTYSKGKSSCKIDKGEKLCCVISLGYGQGEGIAHKNKPLESLCKVEGPMPVWFRKGMEAAMLAPTAMNQQKFHLTLEGNTVTAKAGIGFYTKLDLGIIKCHFELGAEGANWKWAD
ncbi:MAG: nitroreductase [Candidatus Niameybacter stercoravium]|nr:nitroreductase [Candidatus Niameybacter stercoravium]